MKLLSLLFAVLVVGALTLTAHKSMNARSATSATGAPPIDVRKPAGGVPLEAFSPEAAEAATKARMERAQ
ncbi:hypothetical protein WG922_19575 [Ramlibacter sp. AN1015]|uniref:hypothetical protein n=1 Tax=Ramlibacter sp. AN1015 TaxID=3133428 RepID=UPI0030BA4159